ncbi:MAG: sugar phosphate nucleotidyltransferase [Candidatus Hydrothermarchaeales archaeon]
MTIEDYPTVIATVGGEGIRLFPLTLNQPKPLVDMCNRAIIARMFEPLVKQGCRRIIIASKGEENTSHLNKYFKAGAGFFTRLKIEEWEEIEYQPNYSDMGNADAVRYCMEYYGIDDEVLVVSGDNVVDIDIEKLVNLHEEKNALLTVGLKELEPNEDVSQFGVARVAEDMRLSGFVEKPNPGEEPSRLINTSIYLFSPEIRDVFGEMGDQVKDIGHDVIPYLTENGYPVYGYMIKGYWADVGTPERFWKTTMDILHQRLPNIRLEHEVRKGIWIHPTTYKRNDGLKGVEIKGNAIIDRSCTIGEDVKIEDSCIGHTCVIGDGVTIKESIVMDFADIRAGVYLNKCIVGRHATVEEGSRIDADLSVEFGGELMDKIPVVGGGELTIFRNSVIGPGKRAAPLRHSHRILSCGIYRELGMDDANVYFIEKI